MSTSNAFDRIQIADLAGELLACRCTQDVKVVIDKLRSAIAPSESSPEMSRGIKRDPALDAYHDYHY